MRFDQTQVQSDLRQSWETDWASNWGIYFWRLREHYKVVMQYLHGEVLDIGCGPGYLAGFLWPNEAHFTGVDISQSSVDKAKEIFPAGHFLRCDAARDPIPLPDRSFDTVVLSETVEHIPDFHHILAEAKRLSREYIVVTVPISMGGCGHVWPEWSHEDIVEQFGGLGKILEIRENREYDFWLVWIRK